MPEPMELELCSEHGDLSVVRHRDGRFYLRSQVDIEIAAMMREINRLRGKLVKLNTGLNTGELAEEYLNSMKLRWEREGMENVPTLCN